MINLLLIKIVNLLLIIIAIDINANFIELIQEQ